MPKTKKQIVVSKAKVTYRLSLMDSNNHSVFIDVVLEDLVNSKECYTAVTPLIEKYAETILEHEEAQKSSIENDKEVKKVADKKQAEKQKALPKSNDTQEEVDEGDDIGDDDELSDEEAADLE